MINTNLKNSITIHHIVFTIMDLSETEIFYTKIFGQPFYSNESTSMYQVGQSILIFTQKEQQDQLLVKFNPLNIGLEHIAFGLKNLKELQEVEKVLTDNDIQNSGIHLDKSSKKEKIWLNDPSNIRIEFYL